MSRNRGFTQARQREAKLMSSTGIGDDIRVAARSFLRTPWAVAGILMLLALGTGLNSAVLAVTYGILLRPLPYADISRLVVLQHDIRLADLGAWRQKLRTVDDLTAFATADHSLRGLGEPRIVRAAFVSREFFRVLGVEPAAAGSSGSRLTTGVVLSERVVQASGTDARQAIGTAIRIGDGTFQVAAVMPSSVAFPTESVEAWIPAEAAPAIPLLRNDDRRYTMVARMRRGVTIGQIQDDATRVARETNASPGAAARKPIPVTPLATALSGDIGQVLWTLSLGAALVLLVTCANVTALLLGRAMTRERETAIRLALGAGPGRVLRALSVEALLLALVGSLAGAGAAALGVRILRRQAVSVLPRLEAVRVDGPVLAMSLMVGLAVALLFTIAPSLYSLKRGISPLLSQSGRHATSVRRETGAALVMVQLSLSVVILITSVLLGRTVSRLLAVDLGINPEHGLTMKLMLGERSLLKPGERRAFVDRLLDEIRALPGVQSVGLGSSLPPQTSQVQMAIRLVDNGRDETQMMGLVAARGDLLGALGARRLLGRDFEPDDVDREPVPVIISRSVARHLFRDRDPIGQPVPSRLPGNGTRQAHVVGVVDDVRYTGLAAPRAGAIYVPWDRLPLGSMYMVVRSTTEPMALAPAVRAAIARLDPAQPIAEIRSLDDTVRSSVADRRLHAFVASAFAALALVVALVGLVVAVSRRVQDRRRELAIRVALGSTRTGIVRLVMSSALRLALYGVGIGLLLALAAAKILAARLFGVSAYDPGTYAAVGLATAVVATLACAVPACRAAKVDPGTLLRLE
jgi:putative ABC transport system permease protein